MAYVQRQAEDNRQQPDSHPPVADLRSDTVTRPTAAMRDAIARAEVGDDVYGEDPTVNRLEAIAAERLGVDAAVFFPTATQANLAAILTHCGRGTEFVIGERYHIYRYEGGGSAVLGGVAPFPIPTDERGAVAPADVAAAVKPEDPHFPRTSLLCLENTVSGRALPVEAIRQPATRAHEYGLAVHLDGARLFNACVALGCSPATMAGPVDSVTLCLSKGLGTPAGALLCGTAAFVHEARRLRKMLGGSMRQAGILAAAGIHALENHVDRLSDDHRRAQALANGLSEIDALEVDVQAVQSNMLFVRPRRAEDGAPLVRHLAGRGIRIAVPSPWSRLVTHLDIDDDAVTRTVDGFRAFFRS